MLFKKIRAFEEQLEALFKEDAVKVSNSINEFLNSDAVGLGDGLGYIMDGDGGIVVGLDKQLVEGRGGDGGGVETGTEG